MNFINHSGGAIGSDQKWDEIGKKYGFNNHIHYWYGQKTPFGNKEITKDELEEGWKAVLKANESLKRWPYKYKNLLSRNWMQVKNSESIFAIGALVNNREVKGGTGWAVQMAIDNLKPIYLFEQNQNQWFIWYYNKFVELFESPPILTQNYAGIGTREINGNGLNAIEEIYKNMKKLFEGL